ncbi:MAG: family 78 glycoside hydrolase catalytic domain [Clostridia bacterium]|nr:family 78 glycoside hydrolase catalytic domain [Clostridia bacterium]
MTHNDLFGNAKWVSADKRISSPLFRAEFTADDIKNAEIFICGLGFFELHINGRRVNEDLLVPAFSQYCYRDLSAHYTERQDKMSYRTYVCKYTLTDYLADGKNAIGVQLGNGWYNLNDTSDGDDDGDPTWTSYGELKLCYRIVIEHSNGAKTEILSDESLKCSESEITFNNIYGGERHDYSLAKVGFSSCDYDDSGWSDVSVASAPDTEFLIQTCPPDRVIRNITPVLVKDFGETSIYDCGEVITGYAVIKSKEDGATLTARYADALKADSTLDFYPSGGDGEKLQQEVFANTKAGESYFPHFCWHAFRYIEVSDNAEIVAVNVVHSDCAVTSNFESDNEVLNWLYKTYLRTQLDNMHCGVPSDCPHIERLGYTGDGQLCAEAVMLMTNSRLFYKKWMGDIADCQDVETGHVQHTTPFCGGGGGPAAWGGAIVVVPYVFYKTYGEKDAVEQYFPNMLKYIEYMVNHSESGLVCREEKEWCLGDWCAPMELHKPEPHTKSRVLIPETFVNTVLFIKQMKMTMELAEVIGKEDEVSHLPELIEKASKMINIAYYSPMTHCYCGDVQGANCLALDAGLGDEKTLQMTVDKYRDRERFDTGIVATDVLPRILFESGNAQLAFDLMTARKSPSFGYMMEQGATTLWEDWLPERSLNHPMFGALTRYLFTYLLGITQQSDSVGFEKIKIAPCLVNGMDKASGYICTEKGKITVSYEKTENKVNFIVGVPEGETAEFECGEYKTTLKESWNEFTINL